MKITIFGSCRQNSFYNIPKIQVTGIQENISYPHYTKEVLELIKFCKEGHVSPEETITTFRTPALLNKKLYFNDCLKNNFYSSDCFIIEISSKKSYKHNNKYVHHIFYDDLRFNSNKEEIMFEIESDEEIEKNIMQILDELKKPIIIISHIVTQDGGSRQELSNLLENICKNNKILFINPAKEIKKLNDNLDDLLISNDNARHYNEFGHSIIKTVYEEFLKLL
jgi:hypothetical protein